MTNPYEETAREIFDAICGEHGSATSTLTGMPVGREIRSAIAQALQSAYEQGKEDGRAEAVEDYQPAIDNYNGGY